MWHPTTQSLPKVTKLKTSEEGKRDNHKRLLSRKCTTVFLSSSSNLSNYKHKGYVLASCISDETFVWFGSTVWTHAHWNLFVQPSGCGNVWWLLPLAVLKSHFNNTEACSYMDWQKIAHQENLLTYLTNDYRFSWLKIRLNSQPSESEPL